MLHRRLLLGKRDGIIGPCREGRLSWRHTGEEDLNVAWRIPIVALLALCLSGRASGSAQIASGAEDDESRWVRGLCTPCHAMPPPDSLPREAWRRVVFEMKGLALQGVGAPLTGPMPDADFPPERVVRWFTARAPERLPDPEAWPEVGGSPVRFARHRLAAPGAERPLVAGVAFLDAGDATRPRSLLASEMGAGRLLVGEVGGRLETLARVAHPARVERLDLDRDGRLDLLAADLGSVGPGDHLDGSVVWLRGEGEGAPAPVTLAGGLPRVSDARAADFDADGDLDVVVAAFGWRWVGGVLLLENRTADWTRPSFVVRELDARTGAIHVPVADLDGDGRPDFVALLAQQHEAVVAFHNDGAGGFTSETLDAAPHPAWGSSGLDLADLDGDGDLDALVTNGDMLDDFTVKPYHGVRWLENRGGGPWRSHRLAGLAGASRALAVDLDGDGDLDVVACAYVAPPRADTDAGVPPPDAPSLVWLEQTAPGRFERHTLERGGGHVSLDAADYDGDGDVDLAVGSFRGPGDHAVEVWENGGSG